MHSQSTVERFWSKVLCVMQSGCWEWQGARGPQGYGRFSFGKLTLRAHRVSWRMTFGVIPEGMWVCHRCDNPPCVNPAHLFVATPTGNWADMNSKGRRVTRAGEMHWTHSRPAVLVTKGSRNGASKLTETQVIELRRQHTDDAASYHQLAAAYGVSHRLVSLIIRRRIWTHC